MSQVARIAANASVTAVNVKGSSVANIFNNVIELSFDYFKGVFKVVDASQGEFYFPLTPVTTITITVVGATTTITIS